MNPSQNESKIYFLLTSDEPNNVILGHAAFAKQAGLQPIFVFPFRKQSHDLISYSQYEVLRMNFIFSTDGIYKYSLSMIKYIYYATILIKTKKSKILAVDLTGVIAAAVLKIKGNKIFALVNDNFSARYKMRRGIYLIMRWIEGKAYEKMAEVCIFPSKIRYEILGSPRLKKIEYLPNILNDNFVPLWVGSSSKDLKVMLCGWLVKSRGLGILEDIILHTDQNVKFIMMGSGDDQLIQRMNKNEKVQYFGHGTRKETLSRMSEIDINLALYDPDILINRFALPQKIYDAMMIGCPLLVNREVQMSEELKEEELCYTASYADAKEIAEILNQIAKNKEKLKDMSRKILKYNEENLSYSRVTTKGLEIYTMLAKQ